MRSPNSEERRGLSLLWLLLVSLPNSSLAMTLLTPLALSPRCPQFLSKTNSRPSPPRKLSLNDRPRQRVPSVESLMPQSDVHWLFVFRLARSPTQSSLNHLPTFRFSAPSSPPRRTRAMMETSKNQPLINGRRAGQPEIGLPFCTGDTN